MPKRCSAAIDHFALLYGLTTLDRVRAKHRQSSLPGVDPMSVTFNIVGNRDENSGVNVSNPNARLLLTTLGLPVAEDFCGDMPASTFAQCCMKALNLAPEDPGTPTTEPLRSADHARYIEAGRRPGYVQDMLEKLWKLALSAPQGGTIAWY